MNVIAITLILLAGFACGAECQDNSSMVQDFDAIKPSDELTWTPCYDDFACSRLQVPLDYSNPSLGTASIAFMKLAGKNATADSQSFVIIPGGPGGSSIELLQDYKDIFGTLFGDTYNFIGFEPRGVGRSSPYLDCFRNNTKAREAFNRAHYTGATNTSAASLEEQYYSAAIYGEWCDEVAKKDSPFGYYVTTPAVARDLLSFVEADAKLAGRSPPSEAKLWGFAESYGTVIGTTFASMFPDRVGRLVLESVMDVDQYYTNDWRSNFANSDEAVAQLPLLCHAAGPDRCSFWGPTPENITARMDQVIENIKSHPIPVSGVDGQMLPGLATYSDLKYFLNDKIYEPLMNFPVMAGVFAQLEKGNGSALIGQVEKMYLGAGTDGGVVIRCADSYRANKLTTMEEWKHYIQDTVASSKYIGDIFPIWARTILCRSMHPQLPDSMMVQGPVTGIGKPMSSPILFTGNTLDPVAPAANAQKMASRFPGSGVLLQEAVGQGLRAFEEVTYTPEYYLTDTEIALLEAHSHELAQQLEPVTILLELGSGCLRKTGILRRALVALGKEVDYYALDLDRNDLVRALTAAGPGGGGDGRVIPGLDGCRDAERVFAAYNDPSGVSRRFVLNALDAANSHSGYEAFNARDWAVKGQWNAIHGRHMQYLVPLVDVEVALLHEQQQQSVTMAIKAGEKVELASSYKFDEEVKGWLWEESGLRVAREYLSPDGSYVASSASATSIPSFYRESTNTQIGLLLLVP